VEDRGVKIDDVVAVFHGMESNFVSGSVGNAAADAAAGELHGKPVGVMIPPSITLASRSPAEFRSPHDESFLEQAPLFEILEQAGDGEVDPMSFPGPGPEGDRSKLASEGRGSHWRRGSWDGGYSRVFGGGEVGKRRKGPLGSGCFRWKNSQVLPRGAKRCHCEP
jgi:hypothetical protein